MLGSSLQLGFVGTSDGERERSPKTHPLPHQVRGMDCAPVRAELFASEADSTSLRYNRNVKHPPNPQKNCPNLS